ncbi:histone-lysine N-methyltransferase setd3 isoform X1 [Canna indica]|uniref:Histone-lysine N-methyltransferase setd3 isoform X1 n=1 Tax=Canna indica TaxID=4628 RepID=A0AAQ3KDC3_9LILI|nr:histone-lysine N-methyltransferase setd3 isoform X1 [Canna indica]
MATVAASRMLLAAVDFAVSSSAASLVHRRPLTFRAAASRLVPQPPDLIHWLRREGGFVHPKLRIADRDPYGLGVVATDEIPSGTELIALPTHVPLRFDRAPEAADGAHSTLMELAQRIPDELWAMRLGLRLLQERATVGSFWWPYISNLPETFSVPIFFPGDDIKNLQYAPLIHQVNKRCRFLLEFEKEIKSILNNVSSKDHPFGGQDVNTSSLGWAMSAVSSRAFRLHGEIIHNDKRKDIPMLLPLIDMCNHSFVPNARIVQEDNVNSQNMSIKVVADMQMKQNMPVLLNYGCLSNDFFLLDYGFVIPSNPHDRVELKYDEALLDAASLAAGVSSPSFLSPTDWQQEILSHLNLRGDEAVLKVTLGGPELIDGRLLAALRVLLSSDKEAVEKHNLNTLMTLSEEAPLGLSIELSALRTVIALCVVALQSFPSKIMQDESILKKDISSSTDLAVQFRMQKKLLIVDVMRKITHRVKMISKIGSTA